MILDFILKHHLEDCLQILSEHDILGYYSIKIDFSKFFEMYPDIGDELLYRPIESLITCNMDIIKAQQNILEQDIFKHRVQILCHKSLKKNVHARFFCLPICSELHRTLFPKNVDIGCFMTVQGTVVRVTQSKMLEYQRKYVCMKCKYENEVKAEFETRYVLKPPSKCGNTEKRCRSSTFAQVPLVSREHCKDYQEIKIQEIGNRLGIGTIPGAVWAVLENDLVDSCKPGDSVNVSGIVRRRWRPTIQNKKADVDLVLQVNYLKVCNLQQTEVVSTAPDVEGCFSEFWTKFESCPLKGRDHILSSVCPQVYGLHLVKLAVLLTVITGSNHTVETKDEKKVSQDDSHTTRVRGQCHLLLVGDPGTGKSQLLRAGADLASRAVFTSGAGSTRAGLTCAALKEDGEWQLEAGALVLSDGGVCCIDEISQLREHDRTAIHEAMEQQTISIAKAGIVCTLNTHCAVIAACNPKGHYETDQPLSVNVSLGTPLLSRFDLIFILLDTKNKAWDKLVSSYILFGGSNSNSKVEWSQEKLQLYISFVGPKQTTMTKEANLILQSYYMMQRQSEYRDPSRTTVRMLDSLVRLSQAHCRLMYRTSILPMDAIFAVSLVDLSMQDCTLSDTVDALHSTFHKYPDFAYLSTAKNLLTKLNLPDIWKKELLFYGKLLQVDHKTLENDLIRGNYKLFTKYDDVVDDNIPLSATLVTSSYFNDKKNACNNEKMDNISEKENVGQQCKVTNFMEKMKTRVTMNKTNKMCNVSNKRKRKERAVDVKIVKGDSKKKRSKAKHDSHSSSGVEDEMSYANNIVNAIPSVNDIFADLGMDCEIEIDDNQVDTKKSIDKLKEFQFKPNHDLTKYYEEKVSDKKNLNGKPSLNSKTVVKAEDVSKSSQSLVSSQASIFETSGCDGDLDLDPCSKLVNKTVVKLEKISECSKPSVSSQMSIFETSDCDIDDNPSSQSDRIVVKLENSKISSNNNSKSKSTISGSQISIFESSDCDIDLDI